MKPAYLAHWNHWYYFASWEDARWLAAYLQRHLVGMDFVIALDALYGQGKLDPCVWVGWPA